MKTIFKKCYVAVVQNGEGKIIGTVVVEIPWYQTAFDAHVALRKSIGNNSMVKFERIK
jgi:hypothetical protein